MSDLKRFLESCVELSKNTDDDSWQKLLDEHISLTEALAAKEDTDYISRLEKAILSKSKRSGGVSTGVVICAFCGKPYNRYREAKSHAENCIVNEIYMRNRKA